MSLKRNLKNPKGKQNRSGNLYFSKHWSLHISTHLVIPDPHAHPDHNNDRADLLAKLIIDLKPDVVINIGDQFDLSSLSGYDKGKRSFVGRSYRADIDAGLEFSDRLWGPVKKTKKRLPLRIFFEGNHEHRIERALDLSPEMEGTIGFADLELDNWYDEIVRYDGSTPGIREVDGIFYAHYFISGVMGRPLGGEHPAYSLYSKLGRSCTAGHLHTLDYCVRTSVDGRKNNNLVAGCFFDYNSDWAGKANDLYWRGVIIKRNVENGEYNPQFVSIDELKKTYASS